MIKTSRKNKDEKPKMTETYTQSYKEDKYDDIFLN